MQLFAYFLGNEPPPIKVFSFEILTEFLRHSQRYQVLWAEEPMDVSLVGIPPTWNVDGEHSAFHGFQRG